MKINAIMSDYLDPNNEELLKDFFIEAEMQVDSLEQNILVLENDPSDPQLLVTARGLGSTIHGESSAAIRARSASSSARDSTVTVGATTTCAPRSLHAAADAAS